MADMFNAPWHQVNNCISPGEALTIWSSIYQNITEKHMPAVQKKVKRPQQPKWINEKLQTYPLKVLSQEKKI